MKRFFALLFVACSPPDLGTAQAEPACRAYASAFCAQTQSCSSEIFDIRWPDITTCTTYITIQCINTSIAPSSGQTAATLGACTTALPTWDCGSFLDTSNPPPACSPPAGKLPNGAPCAKSAQCQSSFCGVAPTATCGTCAPSPPPGSTCAASCGAGMYCNDQDQCVIHPLPNEACSIDQTCQNGYSCISSVCVQAQTTAGSPCGLASPNGCSDLVGLDCNYQTQSCAPAILVAAGQPCGNVLFGQQSTHCGGGATCANDGTCTVAVGLGQPCDSAVGPTCISPARCITSGGTSGTCTITDATTCN